jgi:hypothetical protein
MSRGLGRIERIILKEIEQTKQSNKPQPVRVHSWGLVCGLADTIDERGRWQDPPRATRKAVTRAMHSFVRKFPQYALMGGQGRRILYLYEPGDPLSTLWTQLNVERGPVSLTEAKSVMSQSQEV